MIGAAPATLFGLALLDVATKLVPAGKRLRDAVYKARFGMTHAEAVERHNDMVRRHKESK